MYGFAVLVLIAIIVSLVVIYIKIYLDKIHIERIKFIKNEILFMTLSNEDTTLRIRKKFIDCKHEFDYGDFKWISRVKYYKETHDTKWFIELTINIANPECSDESSFKKPSWYYSTPLTV